MYDKRVHRGNSYAAMVIPAGTSHDTMIMEKRQTQKAQSMRQRTFKSTAKVSKSLLGYCPSFLHVTNLTHLYRPPSESYRSTPIETFPLQSPCPAVLTFAFRLTNISRT